MESGALGRSDLVVSRLSLGSWRTFERIPREAGAAVLRAARDAGITFLDDARYNDESGTAPLATGWSEVVFGGLFRDVGWPLIAAGKLRAWGTLNWPADALAAAVVAATDQGVPPPCATQLPYNLVHRSAVESPEMSAALGDGDVAVVASAVLAGGALTGKYWPAPAAGDGRLSAQASSPRLAPALAAARELSALAAAKATTPAALALAFALGHPRVASVLFGATTAAQVTANAEAVAVAARLDPDTWAALRAIGP
jgi:aryl-alcohol dehydrogenase-like predicted oxidoreductase